MPYLSLLCQKICGIAVIFAFFNLIPIRGKSYVVAVNTDRQPIETQQNVATDDRCVADGQSWEPT